ncbi:hypothetical protein D3C80_1818100 [compost metagenome]
MPGETLGFDRGEDGRHIEDLGCFGQTYGVVLQRLPVNALYAKSHLRLLIDEDQLAVERGQDFSVWIAHCSSLLLNGSESFSASRRRVPSQDSETLSEAVAHFCAFGIALMHHRRRPIRC